MSTDLKTLTLSLTLLMGLGSSCLGTEVGNPEDDGEVTLQLQGVSELPGALSLNNGVTLDEVWLSIRDTQLWTTSNGRADKCNGPKLTLTQEHSYAELISAQELPSPISAPVEATSYCKLKLKLATPDANEQLPEGVPPAARDYTIIIQGKRADKVPFELRVRDQRILWFEPMQEAGFTLSSGRNPLLIGLQLSSWFDVDALNALEPGEDGSILIDSDGPRSVFIKDFLMRFRRSAGLYQDANADDQLQASEHKLAQGSDEDED